MSTLQQRIAERAKQSPELGFTSLAHLMDKYWMYAAIDETDKVSCRPDFAVLIYPAYLATKDHTALAPDIRITKEVPAMFLAHANDDGIKAENSVLLYLALKRAGVPAELHVYAAGGHGFGLRPSGHSCSTWPKRCEEWLRAGGILKANSIR